MPRIAVEVSDADVMDLVKQSRKLDPGAATGSRVVDIVSIPATANTTASYRVTVEISYDFTGPEVDSLIRP
ncbi:hypothetical protein [Microbacterium maritypicum]